MPEWLKGPVLKTGVADTHRGFESHPLRQRRLHCVPARPLESPWGPLSPGAPLMTTTMTLLHDGRADELTVADLARPAISPEALQGTLGWELQPEGLCQGPMCVPVDEDALVGEHGLDLRVLAGALQRPLVTDEKHAVAALGASHHERGEALASLIAPDFTLPDLDGVQHSLSDQRGKKVLLVAYASW